MKEYIVGYTKENKQALQERLAAYNPHYFRNTLYCAVQVKPEGEKSLLEVLAATPGITYREASEYKKMKEE